MEGLFNALIVVQQTYDDQLVYLLGLHIENWWPGATIYNICNKLSMALSLSAIYPKTQLS